MLHYVSLVNVNYSVVCDIQ